IKICEVFDRDPVDVILNEARNEKILFGLSQYGGHERLSDILQGIKKKLKNHGRNARFLNNNYANITSGQLNKSFVLDKGIDLIRCFSKGKEYWGKTIVFQDIDAYSKRDYDKPRRDMKVGMMPPKLAQMMINFARPVPPLTPGPLQGENSDSGFGYAGTTIYDPFCGLGTTLMEGALRGNPVMGSDIKGRLVHSTLENLTWLQKEFQIPTTDNRQPITCFQHDATQPFPEKKFPKNLVVVTEGYLGPPLLRYPNQQQQKDIFDLLHVINFKFFLGLSQIIPKGNRLVMTFPFFRMKEEKVFYPEKYLREYEKAGFTIENDLRSLLYERENQVVGREVLIFDRVGTVTMLSRKLSSILRTTT
ncbi:MAG: hypothetical protein U1C97_03310, partial [Candidatus Gracilibacteria bacterium]|nr:hypothetical protein [Candidatus Gracilibacteria bacterium]